MIKVQTVLKVSDNTGAVYIMCIKILNISKKQGALPSHEIKGTVKKRKFKKKVFKKFKEIKKGGIYTCLIIRNIRGLKRWGNYFIQSFHNCLIIINNYSVPLGSRVFGPVFLEIKNYSKYSKVISLAEILL